MTRIEELHDDIRRVAEGGGGRTPLKGGEIKTIPLAQRYLDRRMNMAEALSRPPRSTPWRVENFVADGTATVFCGAGGLGKTWVILNLALGVARGRTTAGLLCAKGSVVVFDAEMGEEMMADRFRAIGADAGDIAVYDAMGLDLSREDDLRWVRSVIEDEGATLAVFDSLRRLVPSKRENESDDMAPVVANIAKLARDTGAAIVCTHHDGVNQSKIGRGSTAIRDQCDAYFGLSADDDDPDLRRLTAKGHRGGKFRYAAEPEFWIRLVDGIATACDGAPERPKPSTRVEELRDAIVSRLPQPSQAAVARGCGTNEDNNSFRAAWRELVDAGLIVKAGSGWQKQGGGGPETLGNTTTTPLAGAGANGKFDTTDPEPTSPGRPPDLWGPCSALEDHESKWRPDPLIKGRRSCSVCVPFAGDRGES